MARMGTSGSVLKKHFNLTKISNNLYVFNCLFVCMFRANSAEQVANENKAKENNPEHPPEGESWTAA